MPRSTVAEDRIPVFTETREALKEFKAGLGGVTFDEAIQVLLKLVVAEGEDAYQAGKRLRDPKERSA